MTTSCLILLSPPFLLGAETENKNASFPIDPLTGLKMAPGWELVRNNCIACHSTQQFLRQRGTRRTWEEIIRWMQNKAGLWKLEPEIEARILDYLTENHGPGDEYRRAPIPATLLPENPYPTLIPEKP